jgi:hypothetical protein
LRGSFGRELGEIFDKYTQYVLNMKIDYEENKRYPIVLENIFGSYEITSIICIFAPDSRDDG